MTWKSSPTWPASLQGRNDTLPLAADTDISVSPCALRSESWRMEKKKKKKKEEHKVCTRNTTVTSQKGGKNLAGKILLRENAFPGMPLKNMKNHSLA